MPDTLLHHWLYTCSCGHLIELTGPRRKPHLLICELCNGPMETAECEVELTSAGIAALEAAQTEFAL